MLLALPIIKCKFFTTCPDSTHYKDKWLKEFTICPHTTLTSCRHGAFGKLLSPFVQGLKTWISHLPVSRWLTFTTCPLTTWQASFFPPITLLQGLTQYRIWFYQWNVLSQLCSCNWGWDTAKNQFQVENSYFTLFFPPITLLQGLTQCRIWFYQ